MGAVFLHAAGTPARSGPPSRKGLPRLVLFSENGGERTVEVRDLSFAFFRRTYYTRAAPRSQEPVGQRIEVLDRRQECACLRLEDWSKIKFKKLRQIEIKYPQGARRARVRVTRSDGRVHEIAVADLYGSNGPFPPRFGATVDGAYREFPIVLGDNAPDGWPEERLSRIVIASSPPPREGRSRRR